MPAVGPSHHTCEHLRSRTTNYNGFSGGLWQWRNLMLDPDQIIQQQDLLKTHRITLHHCLKQQAMLGRAYAPPAISHCIEEARKEIHRIKLALRSQGVQVDDYIDDQL